MKGALVEIKSAMGAALPNVIMFQFNPETLQHTWSHRIPGTEEAGANPYAVGGMPSERFSFSLSMDATDALAASDPEATQSGIYSRLAALEMLLFPVDTSLALPTGGTSSKTGGSRQSPAAQVPIVLFVWGKGRILPVRITSLTITENLYDTQLNPTQADALIELTVLTPAELGSVPGLGRDLAIAAYQYSQKQRVALVVANLGDSARAMIGMLQDASIPL